MIEYKNTIIIAAIGTCLNIPTHLPAFIDFFICHVRIFTGDGFPFSKQNPGFDWLIQFLNFGGGRQFEVTMYAAYFRSVRG